MRHIGLKAVLKGTVCIDIISGSGGKASEICVIRSLSEWKVKIK